MIRRNDKMMRYFLKRGLKNKEKHKRVPKDGSLTSLFYKESFKNPYKGYHVQVDYIHDSRFWPHTKIICYVWGPRNGEYFLTT